MNTVKKNLLIINILSILSIGCSVSFKKPSVDIQPIPDITKLNNVCIYQSLNTLSSYDKAGELIANKLTLLNIKNKLTTQEELSNCSYILSYNIQRAIEIPTYLKVMHIQINDNEGYSIGSLKYSHIVSGDLITLSSSSFTNTDTKINTLLDQLFNVQSKKESK